MIIRDQQNDAIKSWLNLSGIVNKEIEPPKVNWDLKTPASIITSTLGTEQIRKLHQSNPIIDALMYLLAWFLFIGSWYLLATMEFGILCLPIAIVQALVVTNFFYTLRHDTFMHRQLGGSRLAYFLGILVSLPMMTSYTRFLRHEDHHVHIGYDLFEEHIAELDKVWKRWFCLTLLGLLFLGAGKLRSKDAPEPNKNWKVPQIVQKAMRREAIFHWIWILGLCVFGFFWPYQVLVGYVIPYFLFMPIIFSIKYACQHSETDINNPFHTAAFFKSNWILNIIYFNSIGEMHLIHHIFPRISTWKLGKASRLMRPIILQHKVPKRSFFQIIKGYYFTGKPYRKVW